MKLLVNEKITILVVDDEKSIVDLITMGLETEGYVVYSAFNGEDNIVEVYIRYLRDKIDDKEHNIIKTVRGVGYKVVN